MAKIVEPHRIKSRTVNDADLPRVIRDAEAMKPLMHEFCVGIAHAQVDSKDPLRFFVDRFNGIIINAEIIVGYDPKTLSEGCLTFHGRPYVAHKRFDKVRVRFQMLQDGKLSKPMKQFIRGLDARVFQHEIDHANGVYCYDVL